MKFPSQLLPELIDKWLDPKDPKTCSLRVHGELDGKKDVHLFTIDLEDAKYLAEQGRVTGVGKSSGRLTYLQASNAEEVIRSLALRGRGRPGSVISGASVTIDRIRIPTLEGKDSHSSLIFWHRGMNLSGEHYGRDSR